MRKWFELYFLIFTALVAFGTSVSGQTDERAPGADRLFAFERLTYVRQWGLALNEVRFTSEEKSSLHDFSVFAIGDWRRSVAYNGSRVRSANYGDGVTIGIMDGPVDCTHASLSSDRYRRCLSYAWSNGNISGDRVNDWIDHGTNVAGVAAGADGFGLAPRAGIASAAVFDEDGYWYVNNRQFLDSIDWLVDEQNASVINWSFGITRGNRDESLNTLELLAVRRAYGDALIVKAGGNAGNVVRGFSTTSTNRNVLNRYLNNLIWVGALNAEGDRLAHYSSRPGRECVRGRLERRCTNNNRIMNYWIVAPGSVTSTSSGGGSNNTQGTSFAAPLVAGAAALIQSRWPQLRPHEVRQILLRTATDMGRPGVDPVYGRGALNVSRALRPIRGRVGGVRIRGARADVFQRTGFSTDFSHSVEVMDIFGRDFSAVRYPLVAPASFLVVPAKVDDDSALYLTIENGEEGATGHAINGITYGPLSYFARVLPNSVYQHGSGIIAPIEHISPVIRNLNLGNQAIIYNTQGTRYFAMLSTGDNEFGLASSSIGFSRQFEPNGLPELTVTAALLSERGFHGLSSAEGFGFDTRNQSIALEFSSVYDSGVGALEGTVNHHQTLASYNSDVLNWSNLGITQVNFGYNAPFLEGQIGVNTNLIYASGDMTSSISTLIDPTDFYHRDAEFSITYFRKTNALSEYSVFVTNKNNGILGFQYEARF